MSLGGVSLNSQIDVWHVDLGPAASLRFFSVGKVLY